MVEFFIWERVFFLGGGSFFWEEKWRFLWGGGRIKFWEEKVQSPESRVQSPESRVQSPESRVQSPGPSSAFRICPD